MPGGLFARDGCILRHAAEHTKSDEHGTEIDLSGLTLFPGFIDVPIHGAAGVDTMDASADDLRRIGEFLAWNGVTSWLPTLVPARDEEYEQAVREIGDAMHVFQAEDGIRDLTVTGVQTCALPI